MPTANACDYCRYRKRKCDRAYPRCSLCLQRDRICEYASSLDQQPGVVVHEAAPTQQQIMSITAGEFPNSFFLDHDIFISHKLELPLVELPLHPLMVGVLADSLAISQRYFDWVHLWMPVVSKNRWYHLHLSPLVKPRSDVKLVVFCMRLLEWSPKQASKETDPRTEEYAAAKQMLFEAETRGLLSLQFLQAMLMVLIYEYAHAIYPAAAVTAAICVKHALILGIDKQRKAELEYSILDSDEQEERRRVWWFVFILDRMMSRGTPICPEPRADAMLPVADHTWDNGDFNVDNLSTVTTPATTNMGMLARLSQAAYLLGRVHRHKQSPTGDSAFDAAERIQLDRSLRSLINLTYEEGATRLMAICPQTAVCFSALVTLHSRPDNDIPFVGRFSPQTLADGDHNSTNQDYATIEDALNFLRPLAKESWGNMAMFYRRRPWSIEKSSPLLTHWTYLIAITFMKMEAFLDHSDRTLSIKRSTDVWSDPGDRPKYEASQGLAAMKHKLALLGKHWCAADAYLRLLEARAVAQFT